MKRLTLVIFAAGLFLFAPVSSFSQWLNTPADEPKNDKPDEAMKWFMEQRTFGLGYIPKDARLNALKQKEALRNKYFPGGKNLSTESVLGEGSIVNWINIGPFNIQGRVSAIVPHPTDKNIAWLGAAQGGIWKTTNAGNSWQPLSDNTYSLAMGGLCVDPKNPNILYAGTGDAQANDYFGCGILKTIDGGKTWNPSGLGNVGAFSKLIVSPTNSSRIYAAGAGSGGGFYFSTDAGSTWTKATGSFPFGEVTDISCAKNNGNDMIYAAMPGHGIYLSQDGGLNWNLVQDFSNNGATGQMRRLHVAVDPKNWMDVVALSVAYNSTLEALVRSTDGGASWSDITNGIGNGVGNGDIFTIPIPPYSNIQGWYDAYLARDPNNPKKIVVGGISVWMSTDGGNTWSDVGGAYQGGIHPDQHAFAFAPGSSAAYAGSDGGIHVSGDGGSTFSTLNDSLAITQSYGMAIDQVASDLTYTGNQDNGTLSGGRNGDWGFVDGGDGAIVVLDAANHTNEYHTRPAQFVIFHGSDPSVFSSGLETDSVQWLFPFTQDVTTHKFYTGTQYLYMANSGGSGWTKRAQNLAYPGYLTSIAPAGDGKTLLVGTTGGKVWSTINNGVSFTDRTKGLPGRSVTGIIVSPSDKSTFYIILSGFGASHVMKTSDLGATWKDISSTLPDIACNGIVIDDQHPTNLYIATDIGVFFSPDDGVDWVPYGTGLPHVVVPALTFHKTKRVLRAGTYGRSVWEAPVATTISGITTPTVSNIWYTGEAAQVGWYGVSSPAKVEISPDNGSSWNLISASASGTNFAIPSVSFSPTENAIIRVTSGADILLSQNFRIRNRPAGSTLETFSEQPLYMYDVAYDKDDKTLWVTNFTSTDNKIYKIDPDNGTQTGSISVAGGRDFTGIKYDPASKHLFVHQSNQTTNTSFVFEIDITGKVIRKFSSPCKYGTGIYVSGDSLFLADRNSAGTANVIHVVSKSNPNNNYTDLALDRNSPFGSRCITFDPATGNLLHTWTDFQGTDASATLYDSYILRLNRDDGTELNSWFVQDGANSGTNVRGIELDPRAPGTVVWVTVLNNGSTSAKILKINLASPKPQPLVTILISPPNGSQNLDTGVTFTWAQASEAVSYEFQLSTTADFTSLITDNSKITGTSITINGLAHASTYYWRVKASGTGTNVGSWSDTWNFEVKKVINRVSDIGSTQDFYIKNYPNPFSAKTIIEYYLDTDAPFSLKLYDLLGREIRLVASGSGREGEHSTSFDGQSLADGVYNLTLVSGGRTTSHLIHLVK